MHNRIIALQYKEGPWYKPLCNYALFTIPPVSTFANAMFTNVVLSTKPLGSFLTIAIIYIIFNFLITKVDGKPILMQITIKRFVTTMKESTILLCIFMCFYFILCKIDEILKPELTSKRD